MVISALFTIYKKMISCKIRKSTLEIFLLCISFYEFSFIPHEMFLMFKYVIIMYLLFTHMREIRFIKSIVFSLIMYGGITFISTIINQDYFNRYVAAFMQLVHLVVIYLTIFSFLRRRTIDDLVKILAVSFGFMLFFTDALMLFVNYDFSSSAERYLIGDKFTVSYLHCFFSVLIIFMWQRTKNDFRKKYISLFAALFSTIICMCVTCTTGVIICIVLIFIMYTSIPIKIKRIMANPMMIIGVVFIVNILILGSYSLLTNPLITEFVQGILGKGGTWIGRLNIYKIVMDIIYQKLWLGYGYFSNIINDIMGFGNAQNGVLKILIDSGVIGLVAYIAVAYKSLKEWKINAKEIWSLMAYVYCMIIASFVEINLTDNLFFLTLAIIFSYSAICSKNFNNR